MRIGITERGDASIDFSWVNKMDTMDGVVLITKNLTDKVISLSKPYLDKMIFHITCTGYGGTIVEPNIPEYREQLNNAKKLLDLGIDIDKIVIRVDPIIPTEKGLKRALIVFEDAYSLGFRRFRVSLMDAYPHVRERFRALGVEPPYGNSFSPNKDMINNANVLFKNLKLKYSDISIESCAEGLLTETERIGCISFKDFEILGLDVNEADTEGYQRKGCLCCSAKTEMLTERKQCPYKCIYCYWKN